MGKIKTYFTSKKKLKKENKDIKKELENEKNEFKIYFNKFIEVCNENAEYRKQLGLEPKKWMK